MVVIEGWFPPSKSNWQIIVTVFKFFPLVGLFQWAIRWYGSGKTSVNSRFNVPGKVGWMTMECWGMLSVLYCMYSIPTQLGLSDLPTENKIMAGLFTVHYIYRAIIGPLIAPSISPIHILIWVFAAAFQIVNGLSIGGWLAGYGPTTRSDWQDKDNYKVAGRMELGMMIFGLGFLGNLYHDDELREIRRAAIRNEKSRAVQADESTGKAKDKKGGTDKVYVVPENGLFKWILYPHYLLEWVEWTGFWIMGGWDCVPARNFVIAEITTMSLRALQGKQWYIDRFGKEKIGNRKAFLPGII